MARPRKTTLLSDMLGISMAMPMWTNLLLAGGSFAVLRYYGGTEMPMMSLPAGGDLGLGMINYMGQFAAYVGQYLLPPVFLLGGVAGWMKRKARARQFNKIAAGKSAALGIRQLSWEQFEQMVGEAFRRQGFRVQETSKGPDGGIDLLLRKDGELHLVQCKNWKADKVSVQIVRELYGVMSAQGAAGGFVVTSGAFTSEAKKFAQGTSIRLVDGDVLAGWFTEKGKHRADTPTDVAPMAVVGADVRFDAPCPSCGDVMIPRFSTRVRAGINAQRVFLGCTHYPKCRGTRSLEGTGLAQ